MTTTPKRRWLRFSLRTLFVVVTVFAVWLGWELKFVRERSAFLTRMRGQGAQVLFADDDFGMSFPGVQTPTIPAWRRWLGDRAIVLPGIPLQEMQSPRWDLESANRLNDEIMRLFPESVECMRVLGGV